MKLLITGYKKSVDWVKNWAKSNADKSIKEIGIEGTKLSRKIVSVVFGILTIVLLLGLINLNFSINILTFFFKPYLALPILLFLITWTIKEIQFNFSRCLNFYLVVLILGLVFSSFGVFIISASGEKSLVLEQFKLIPLPEHQTSTLFQWWFRTSLWWTVGISGSFCLLCLLAVIRYPVSIIEVLQNKTLALILSLKVNFYKGTVLLIIIFSVLRLVDKLFKKMGLLGHLF